MGLMNFLRNRAGVVIVACIGFAIVAFLLGDVVSYGTPFWARNQNQVGSVNGEAIDIAEFNAHVDQTTEMFRQQMGGTMNPQMRSWAVEQVWSQFINRELLNAEIEKVGLTVDRNELNDLVQGDNPSQQILQAFSNPQTGYFDRDQLSMFVSQVRDLPANHEAVMQWNALLENIVAERLNEKFNNLVNNSIYVTSLEAQEHYIQANKLANFEYILLDYSSVGDDEVTVTDADYKAYYDENRKSFVNPEETRNIEFVMIDASPVAEDTARVREEIENLAAELTRAANDSLYAAVNSDTKYPFVYQREGFYSVALDTLLFNAAPGTVVGPVYSNGAFEIAKVVDVRMSPDSIKASHILLNPAAEGGVDKAKAKADSIRNLVLQGESFAALALQFSVDEGSKINGGELGTFSRGMMVPAFEEPVFAARRGDVLVLNTDFGIHIVKVEDVIGSSRVVKAAVIDKHINSGKETIDAAYARATNFFSAVEKGDLATLAAEHGLRVQYANEINARESMLQGVPVKRELIRWAFDAKKGELSDKIYESENNDKYII
ncbi:MAG TPA: peptidylprolyl isomerase, partial [Ohtaekwangia sp.]|nr:peptidylprolyl isomerase [Ohtaekwangia sp.]